MSETIEGFHMKILEKFQYIETIFDQISSLSEILTGIGIKYEEMFSRAYIHINISIDEIKELKDQYNLDVLHILSAYYSAFSSSFSTEYKEMINILHSSFEEYISEENLSKEYFKILKSKNYSQSMDKFVKRAKTSVDILLRRYAKSKIALEQGINPEGLSLLDTVKLIPVADPIYIITKRIITNIAAADACKLISGNDVTYVNESESADICECGGAMYVKSSTSELICVECSKLNTVYGTAAEDAPMNAAGIKFKQSSYDYLRHFKLWIQRIQAKNKKSIKEKELQQIGSIIVNSEIDSVDLGIEKMREILKKAGLTKYNDDCPYLIFYFTGRSPPELSQAELKLFQAKFMRIMELRQILKEKEGNSDGNRPYYPYYIYKIAEIVFAGNDEKLKILDYIHLQSNDTLRKNDNEFKKIVELSGKSDGIYYYSTLRR